MNVCSSTLIFNVNGTLVHAAQAFRQIYGIVHVPLSMMMCILGVISNLLNLVVLTRPRMRSAVNLTLALIAMCDCSTSLSYFVHTLHYKLLVTCSGSSFSYGWAVFLITHSQVSTIAHTTSLWLSVFLAYARIRVLQCARRMTVSAFASMRICLLICIGIALCVTTFNTPSFLMFSVKAHNITTMMCFVLNQLNISDFVESEQTYYVAAYNAKYATANNCLIMKIVFWITGIVFKVMPCLLLFTLFILLFRYLTSFRSHRRALRTHDQVPNGLDRSVMTAEQPDEELLLQSLAAKTPGCAIEQVAPYSSHQSLSEPKQNQKRSRYDIGQILARLGVLQRRMAKARLKRVVPRSMDKTTLMLAVLLFVTLVTEIPQGMAAIGVSLYGQPFRIKFYVNVGDFLNVLSLVNSNINFIIYCCMSAQFRKTFVEIFRIGKTNQQNQQMDNVLVNKRHRYPVLHSTSHVASNVQSTLVIRRTSNKTSQGPSHESYV